MSRTDTKIDKFFREKLENLEIGPPEQVWETVSANLNSGRKRQWLFFLKLAAGVALMAATSYFLYTSVSGDMDIDKNISDEETLKINEQQETAPNLYNEREENLIKRNTDTSVQPKKNNNINNTLNDRNRFVPANIQQESIAEVVEETGRKTLLHKADSSSVTRKIQKETGSDGLILFQQLAFTKLTPIYGIIPKTTYLPNENLGLTKDNDPGNNGHQRNIYWELSGIYGSTYSDRIISSTQLGADEKSALNASESGLNTFAGGIGVRLNLNRWSFESGLYYSGFGQKNEQILTESSPYNRSYEMAINKGLYGTAQAAYLVNNSLGIIAYNSPTERLTSLSMEYVQNNVNSEYTDVNYENNTPIVASTVRLANDQINIIQRVHFLEIPLKVRYKLIDNNFILSVSGGIGANYVAGSQVIFEKYNDEKSVGKISHINELNLSSSLGIGVGYVINRDLTFHIEPTAKIFMNSLNHDLPVNFYPYQIGVFAGFTYGL